MWLIAGKTGKLCSEWVRISFCDEVNITNHITVTPEAWKFPWGVGQGEFSKLFSSPFKTKFSKLKTHANGKKKWEWKEKKNTNQAKPKAR